ncbi:hypothetical protein BD560DRAFT_492996 [Blakeslea trispora]|nr:hypothetical protein BD560DRAFT_492996 [Blakeslea trispora]
MNIQSTAIIHTQGYKVKTPSRVYDLIVVQSKVLFLVLICQAWKQKSLLIQGSIQLRKHATVHFINDTLYLLGGISDLDTAVPSIGLHFNKTDLSLHSPFSFTDLKVYGHTSHFDHTSNSIVSLFGQNSLDNTSASSHYISLLHPNPPIKQHPSGPVPHARSRHTTTLFDQTNLYLIGGASSSVDQLSWQYSLSKQAWKPIPLTHHLTQISGHTSFVYRHWIVSCFGLQNHQLSNDCIWMNTIDFSTQLVQASSVWPRARQFTTMTQLNDQTYILFGGEREKQKVLDDVWQLEMTDTFQMTWTPLHHLSGIHPRSGHTSTDIPGGNLILYYGGQTNPVLTEEAIYLDKIKLAWLPTSYRSMSVNEVEGIQTTYGPALSQASIIAIILAALVVAAGLIVFIVWYFKKKYRHQETFRSRISQFSRSSNYRRSMAEKHSRKRMSAPRLDAIAEDLEGSEDQLMELPRAVISDQRKNHLSAVSLGGEFHFSPSEFFRSSSHLPAKPKANHRSSAIKQLTLQLFSSNHHPNSKPSLLSSSPVPMTPKTPSTPSTPMSRFFGRYHSESRSSLGNQSVASVQWVGLNDSVEFKDPEQAWYNNSSRSNQLAVTNGVTPLTTPNTPTFPAHVK